MTVTHHETEVEGIEIWTQWESDNREADRNEINEAIEDFFGAEPEPLFDMGRI